MTLKEMYDEMLDECYPECMGFYPSDILKGCDPIAYRCGFNNWKGSIFQDWECLECGCNADDLQHFYDLGMEDEYPRCCYSCEEKIERSTEGL